MINHTPCNRENVSYASEPKYGPAQESEKSKGFVTDALKMLDAFCRFSRPHTIFGTVSLSLNMLFFLN